MMPFFSLTPLSHINWKRKKITGPVGGGWVFSCHISIFSRCIIIVIIHTRVSFLSFSSPFHLDVFHDREKGGSFVHTFIHFFHLFFLLFTSFHRSLLSSRISYVAF